MPVVDPNAGIHHGLGAVKEELQKLNLKVDKLVQKQSEDVLRTERTEELTLNTQSHVVWWTKVKEAARYRLALIINSDEVCSIDCDRETRYYAFDKLPKDAYCLAKVTAEDREGKEIVSVSIKL